VGAEVQPEGVELVSGGYDINSDQCHGNEPKRTHFWAPQSEDVSPHCLHKSEGENCDDGAKVDLWQFDPTGQSYPEETFCCKG
jgi:hypothetical protein